MADDADYRCPGESYDISRSVHLGRLASFYPACGNCPHGTDTTSFSVRRARLIGDLQRGHRGENSLFHGEGVSGEFLNQIGPEVARRIGQALGIHAGQSLVADRAGLGLSTANSDAGPRIVIAHDGRLWTAELASEAIDGLHWAGCTTIDIGATTAPCVILAAERDEADGALFVGNPSGEPRLVGLTLWSARGEPMSSPGSLDAVRNLFHSPAPRPRFTKSGHERLQIAHQYLPQLEPLYHALRPLRIVINTTSLALVGYLDQLTRDAAIEIDRGLGDPRRADGASEKTDTWHDQSNRLERIACRVRSVQAHFGIWIDGDGERCRVIDERGELVSAELLMALFVRELIATQSETKIILPRQFPEIVPEAKRKGVEVIQASNTRQAIWRAMREHRADLGADANGRFWFVGEPTCADGLKTLTILLTFLSRSDRPLSDLIASAIL
jgi:phosphomannomutase